MSDIVDRIDEVTNSCLLEGCGRPLGGSPSDVFCSELCQQRWHEQRATPLLESVEEYDPVLDTEARRHGYCCWAGYRAGVAGVGRDSPPAGWACDHWVTLVYTYGDTSTWGDPRMYIEEPPTPVDGVGGLDELSGPAGFFRFLAGWTPVDVSECRVSIDAGSFAAGEAGSYAERQAEEDADDAEPE